MTGIYKRHGTLLDQCTKCEDTEETLHLERNMWKASSKVYADRIDVLVEQLAAMTKERDTLRAALKEILDCPTWAVGTLVAEAKYKLLVEDDVEQARRTT